MRDSIDEDPLEADQDSLDAPEIIVCPYCGDTVSDLAERCPNCEKYLSREERSPPAMPRVFVMTSVALIVLIALGYVCMR